VGLKLGLEIGVEAQTGVRVGMGIDHDQDDLSEGTASTRCDSLET